MGAGLSVAHGISHWVKNTTGKSRATVANNASKDNELKKTKSSSYAIEKKKTKSSDNGNQAKLFIGRKRRSKNRVFKREASLSQPAMLKGTRSSITVSKGRSFRQSSLGFRKRRLTYANQIEKSQSELPTNLPVNVVFKSGEIYEHINMPSSLGPEILGAYSCHGIEPSPESINEICNKVNQDMGCVIHPFMGIQNCILCCIYDGHGRNGDKISNYVMMGMGRKLAKHPKIHVDPAKALIETFLAVNEGLNGLNDEATLFSGCTAVVMLIRNNKMWVANAGDSRAVLCSSMQLSNGEGRRLCAVPLTEDHKPDNPKEMKLVFHSSNPILLATSPQQKKRIIKMGGYVSAPPEPGLSARVWIDKQYTQVGLAMARSLGDLAVKPIGVIANPEVVERDIDFEKDQFVIMASDVVWEFLSSEEAILLIEEVISSGEHEPAFVACERVIRKATELWHQMEGTYRDDITVIVLRLPCF